MLSVVDEHILLTVLSMNGVMLNVIMLSVAALKRPYS